MIDDTLRIVGDTVRKIRSREISTADDTANAASYALENAASGNNFWTSS
jgi:hypothetical protein